MKKEMIPFIIIPLLALTLLGAGCGDETEPYDTDYHTGTQGIEMRFLPRGPPDVVYDMENTGSAEFPVMVELKNKGAYTITNGYIYLGGFDLNIIRGLGQPFFITNLPGKSPSNREGGFTILSNEHFGGGGTIFLPQGQDNYRPPIVANACYEYKTTASPSICVDPFPYSEITDKPCTVTDVSAGTQGAPVAVDRVDVESTPSNILLTIYISNVGGGKVIDSNSITGSNTYESKCPFNVDFRDWNMIDYYDVSSPSLVREYCDPAPGELRLIDDKGVIFCSFAIPNKEVYTTPITIELEYGYLDTIQKTVEIRSTSKTN